MVYPPQIDQADTNGIRYLGSGTGYATQKLRGLKPGRHRFKVAARDSADNVDPKPAVERFRIRL